jgi:hypothetical protein
MRVWGKALSRKLVWRRIAAARGIAEGGGLGIKRFDLVMNHMKLPEIIDFNALCDRDVSS